MAFVPAPTWSASFSFKDNNGNLAVTHLDYPGDLTYAEVVTAVQSMAAAMQAVSDARLISYGIHTSLLNDDVSAIASSSEVERKLSITLGNPAGTQKLATIQVPSPIFTLEQPRTDAIDETNGAWVTLRNALTAGGLGAGNGPVHWLGGEDFGSVLRAVITHRSRAPRS